MREMSDESAPRSGELGALSRCEMDSERLEGKAGYSVNMLSEYAHSDDPRRPQPIALHHHEAQPLDSRSALMWPWHHTGYHFELLRNTVCR